MTQDVRRGIRTVVYAIVTLAAVALLGWILDRADPVTVRHIAYGLLAIVGLGSLGYVAENVTQRVRFKGGLDGVDMEIGK